MRLTHTVTANRTMRFAAQRPVDPTVRRIAAVVLCIRSPVGPGSLSMVLLNIARPSVLVVIRKPLLGAWIVMDAARSAAEGHVAIPGNKPSVHRHPVLIDVTAPSAANAHMHHGRVV